MSKTRVHYTPAEAAANGWRCKTHLKADRLMPGPSAVPVGTVWQGRGAYDVYSPTDCVPYQWEPGPTQRRRQWVAARAKELISSGCLVLDVESTGLGGDAEICEITILDSTGVPLLDTLVRPCNPIPAEATAKNHITDAMVASAPDWLDVAEQYAAIVTGRTIVMYNAAFDRRILWQVHERHGLRTPSLKAECAMLLYSDWDSEWDRGRDNFRWRKLVEAAAECGVYEEGAHRSLADCRMTLGVLHYLQRQTTGRRSKARP